MHTIMLDVNGYYGDVGDSKQLIPKEAAFAVADHNFHVFYTLPIYFTGGPVVPLSRNRCRVYFVDGPLPGFKPVLSAAPAKAFWIRLSKDLKTCPLDAVQQLMLIIINLILTLRCRRICLAHKGGPEGDWFNMIQQRLPLVVITVQNLNILGCIPVSEILLQKRIANEVEHLVTCNAYVHGEVGETQFEWLRRCAQGEVLAMCRWMQENKKKIRT